MIVRQISPLCLTAPFLCEHVLCCYITTVKHQYHHILIKVCILLYNQLQSAKYTAYKHTIVTSSKNTSYALFYSVTSCNYN